MLESLPSLCKDISSDLHISQSEFTLRASAMERRTGILGLVMEPFSYRCIVDLATPTLYATSSSVMEPRAFFMRLPTSTTSICEKITSADTLSSNSCKPVRSCGEVRNALANSQILDSVKSTSPFSILAIAAPSE